MKIKKHRLFRWDSLLWGDYIWLAMVAVPLAALVAIALLAPRAPAPVWIVSVVTALGFIGVTVRRYVGRWRFIKSIRGYTDQGAAVVANQGAFFDHTTIEKISGAIHATCAHWRCPSDWFNGAVITLTPEPFPLPGLSELAAGVQDGNTITVLARANDEARTMNLIRHEAAHLILSRRGSPHDKHHETMAAAGWSY